MQATFGVFFYFYLTAMLICEDLNVIDGTEKRCSLKFLKDFILAGLCLGIWTQGLLST